MELRVNRSSPVPLGAQLEARLRSAIERGELAQGDRLPSLRHVAAEAGVNVNTVRAVYTRLEAAGVVSSEQGRGTFVAPAGTTARRDLRAQIERLEAELVRLPAPREALPAPHADASAGLLSTAELAAVRDELLERLRALDAARVDVVERLQRLDRLESADQRARPVGPARRSSPTLSGAQVRWVPS